jgi:hypothetical protein
MITCSIGQPSATARWRRRYILRNVPRVSPAMCGFLWVIARQRKRPLGSLIDIGFPMLFRAERSAGTRDGDNPATNQTNRDTRIETT